MAEDLEVIDVEDYASSSGAEAFSKPALVMLAAKKCIINGSREMIPDFRTEKMDRMGNVSVSRKEDTRKTFIESVKTLKNILASDADEEFKKNYKEIMKNIDTKFKEYYELEKEEWDSANHKMKSYWVNSLGYYFRKGFLHEKKPFSDAFLDEKVELYRELFEELEKLAKRRDYWREEMLTA